MATGQAGASGFPELVEQAPADQAIVETFGWQPVTWGLFIVAACSILPTMEKVLSRDEALGFLAVGLAGAALVGYELVRRRHRTVLWPVGDSVGVYRGGRLDLVVTRGDLTLYIMEETNTIKLFFFLVLCGAAPTVIAIVGKDLGLKERALAAAAALAFASSLASAVWTRLFLEHFYVPRKSGRNELVMVRRSQRGRLLG